MIKLLLSLTVLLGIAFKPIKSLGRNVFVLEPDNDVYEEVVKPLLEKSKLDLDPDFSS